ncbi:MAG: PadR family transcriptional regulator [Candidatus Thermoplasmatota archaeon]|jgi:DNA-binding PadR family transcriptional regulator|nr:PadR family transcriptional regulator [Candidatus Sysuiplasma jiujiangense]MBX8639184.1 PadR family transcriptional regulator [Candidatus Sysuiplasma jiujiangense]MCL4317822.1 PadR family transcriptional regulator [Candidatus Thermoplasmatota archaeon]MCL5254250.1 PadR family transcriptional regulator [Candidatus Thermoplasmatota archaeon]
MQKTGKLTSDRWHTGLIGLYALKMMEEAPVYGYQISLVISEKTHHTWKPGAGSIYPALKSLVGRGLAEEKAVSGKKIYSITAEGRKALRGIRSRVINRSFDSMEVSRLWFDLIGSENIADFVIGRLRRDLRNLEELIDGADYDLTPSERDYVITMSLSEMERTKAKLEEKKTRGHTR